MTRNVVFSHQMLRRVEHLRRTVAQTLTKLLCSEAGRGAKEPASLSVRMAEGVKEPRKDVAG